MKQHDLLSVDLGWSGKNLTQVALSFLDFKNRKVSCIYRPHLSLTVFLSLLKENLNTGGTILLDIPLKGRVQGFFRPLERAMQKVGLPCRPSRNALIKGRRLSLEIEALGFKAIEIYPYEFYKFSCLLSPKNLDTSKELSIAPLVFRRFFPPYKRVGERGIKNAEKIIKQLLNFLKLKLIPLHPPLLKGDREGLKKGEWGDFRVRWDIYDSIFGAIAGYLLLKGSPWVKLMGDRTGSEILILSDRNLYRILGGLLH